MFLKLTGLDGNLVLIHVREIKYINVQLIKKTPYVIVHLNDSCEFGGTINIAVQETMFEVSSLLSEAKLAIG